MSWWTFPLILSPLSAFLITLFPTDYTQLRCNLYSALKEQTRTRLTFFDIGEEGPLCVTSLRFSSLILSVVCVVLWGRWRKAGAILSVLIMTSGSYYSVYDL